MERAEPDRKGAWNSADLSIPTTVAIDPDALASIDKRLEKSIKTAGIIVVNPNAGWVTKRWLPERFAELSDRIVAKGFFPILIGSPSEKKISEFDTNWPDPQYTLGLPQDAIWQGKEFFIPLDMTQILEDVNQSPYVSDVRVRITDNRSNWMRSDNVLTLQGNYTIADVIFRDDRYAYDPGTCHWHNTERRKVCDGLVEQRPGPSAEATLDTCALVIAPPFSPPDT